MFEYHGWMTLRESTTEIDDGNLETIIAGLQQNIRSLKQVNLDVNAKYLNGSFQISISGNANHRPEEFEMLLDLLKKTSITASGSYGLIYFWDDEDPDFENCFRVYVIRRGSFELMEDSYLSPCIPKIEDDE